MNLSRRALARVLAGLGTAVAFYFMLRETPETRVEALLAKLARALYRTKDTSEPAFRSGLEKTLTNGLTKGVRLSVPELGTFEGREQVIGLALESGGLFEIDVDPVSIHVEDERANARLTLKIAFRLPGSERREQRGARVELEPEGQAFRVRSIEVERAPHEQPEARP